MSDTKWYESPVVDDGIIISSRVRLARNLRRHPFPSRLNAAGAARLLSEVREALERSGAFGYTELTNQTSECLRRLTAQHIISPEMANKKGVRGILSTEDGAVSVMVNEEDHIRIQAFVAGDDLESSFVSADRVDDLIEESLEYAFDPDFGYLTACPTNAGTGLRAGFMLHLPALVESGRLKEVVDAAGKFGITFRGMHGEGSEPSGCVFQISNQTTMGKREDESIMGMKNVTRDVMAREEEMRDHLLSEKRAAIEDKVWRAYGVLTSCRLLTVGEAMAQLSYLRAGYMWGLLDMPKPRGTIYSLMMNVQTSRKGLSAANGDGDDLRGCIERADFVRNAVKADIL